jgi:hypothetical protein
MLTLTFATGLLACTSAGDSGPGSTASGGAAASTGGAKSADGGSTSTGGTSTGGTSTGGTSTGGTSTGGTSTGGTSTGGTSTGGKSNGTGGTTSTASGGSSSAGASSGGGPAQSAFRRANLTNFESYPDPNSEECIKYNGCMWAGQFAGVDGVQPESWVMAHNIVAVHSKDFAKYKLKTLRLRQGTKEIDVTVYDECADSDCDGCCTANSAETGFLIDIEKYTMQRFGSGDGVVEFACLDCP